MKTKVMITILSSLLLFLCVDAQQNNWGYKIYYEMTFRKDSTDTATTTEMTELLISGEKSLFRTVFQAEKDTNEFHKDLMKRPFIGTYTNAKYRILKDYAKQTTHYYEHVEQLFGPIWTYTESRDIMDWTLTSDTSRVNNLLYQRALLTYGNRSWEAWFCIDIPISDGPYTFCGLPGLIVRISDQTGSWSFDLKWIEHVPHFTFSLVFLDNAETMDKTEFYKRKRNYRYNWVQINEAAGAISQIESEQMRQRLIKSSRANLAKNNNGIELYP